MRLIPSDPDIETLVRRIDVGEIDLQPDFQRGDVWPIGKRQKLVDSVLRDWHVPPIHLILDRETQGLSVLDGQQRLSAIRGFLHGEFSVDGRIQPYANEIYGLNGRRFSEFSPEDQRKFLRFSIRVFTLIDFLPAEPGELFFRLNSLSSLTAAEQRNAFFGETRKQVKNLVDELEGLGLGGGVFGFSNARMSYDDVIARALFFLDAGTLRVKATSSVLADKYREGDEFNHRSLSAITDALRVMAEAQLASNSPIRLNKATAQSWLVFLATALRDAPYIKTALPYFMAYFESVREHLASKAASLAGMNELKNIAEDSLIPESLKLDCLFSYLDRSTSRVADVSSVVIRDLVLWIFLLDYLEKANISLYTESNARLTLRHLVRDRFPGYHSVEGIADRLNWGEVL